MLTLFDLFALGASWDTKTSICACSSPLICLVLRDGGGTKTFFLQAHSWRGGGIIDLTTCLCPSCLLTPFMPAYTLSPFSRACAFCPSAQILDLCLLTHFTPRYKQASGKGIGRCKGCQQNKQADRRTLFASTHALALLTPTCPRLRPLAPEPVELVKLSLPNIGTVSRNLRIVIFTLVALKFI